MKTLLHTLEKLNRTFRFDGRWVILFSFSIYGIILWILTVENEELFKGWRKLGVFALSPTFFDLRYVEKGMECVRKGFDIVKDSSCIGLYGWNYPRIWNWLHYTGISEQDTYWLTFIMLTIFISTVFILIRKINFTEGIFYSLIFCAPPFMLAVERMNPDIMIFILMAATLFIIQRFNFFKNISYFIIFLCGLLKFFPVCAMLLSLKEKKNYFIIVNLIIICIFIPYVFFSMKEMNASGQKFENDIWVTTGSLVFADWLIGMLQSNIRLNAEVVHISVRAVLTLIFLFCFLQIKNRKTPITIVANHLDAFRIGAGIFTGTFIFGYNFDYRLISLIFTFPQMLEWCKTKNELRKISVLTLIGVVIYFQYYLYLGVIGRTLGNQNLVNIFTAISFTMKEIIIWVIFTFYVYTLMVTLPDWLKNKIFAVK